MWELNWVKEKPRPERVGALQVGQISSGSGVP